MKHIHVAALEPDAELAKKIGKKGSESDFTIYNCKEEGRVLCLYHPAKYPEKVQPLLYCLSLCDVAYIRPNAIDKFVGEMIVAAGVFGKKLIVVVDKVSREEIEPLLKSANLSSYEFFEGGEIELREKLLGEVSTRKADGKTEVLIDSCFPVKGVGTIALGIVQQGKVALHQRLEFVPAGISSEVKSIQVQDENVDEAEASSRVGLNLKGVEPDKVGKGDLAVEQKFPGAIKFDAQASFTKFYRGDFESVQFFVLSGLKFVACKAKKKGDAYEIEAGAPLPLRAGDDAVLFLPEAMPRVIGKARVMRIIG